MQETFSHEQSTPVSSGRKPGFAIGVAVIILVVLIAAVGVVQYIFGVSYHEYVDKLKGLVVTQSSQIEKGDETPGATLTDEYRFYVTIAAQISSYSSDLKKLNDSYPLYLFRADADSVGLTAVSSKMRDISPKMESLKDCIDEDKGIATQLSDLLGGKAPDDIVQQYSDLMTRNDKLKIAISALSFTGAAEDGRVQLQKSIETRAKALDCLHEDASINKDLILVIADGQASFEAASSKLNDLAKRSDTLVSNMKGLDLTLYNPAGGSINAAVGTRGARIKTDIEYLGALLPLQKNVSDFCAGLNTAPTGKLTAELATYTSWINQVKAFQSQLDTINKDNKFQVADKRTFSDMGLTSSAKNLISFEGALTDVGMALTTSASIEKQINTIMKDTKSRMPDKVTILSTLTEQNKQLITQLTATVPTSLNDQIAQFSAGCTERITFLDDYMNYLIAKSASDGDHAIMNSGTAAASQAAKDYQNAIKVTNSYAAKYKASRQKYLPLLDV